MILPNPKDFKNLPNLNATGELKIVASSTHDGMINTEEKYPSFTEAHVHKVAKISEDSWGD